MMKMLDCKSVDFHHVFLWFRNTEANFLEYFVFSQYNHKSLRGVLLTFLSNGKKCFPVDLPFGENPFKFADILRGKYLGAAAIKSINNENSSEPPPRLHLSHKGKVDIKRLIGVVSFISSSKSCYNRQYIFYWGKNLIDHQQRLREHHWSDISSLPAGIIISHHGLFLDLLYFLRQRYVYCEKFSMSYHICLVCWR